MWSKNKFIAIGIIFILVAGSKYILFNYPVSSGKRIGNLTKLSLKGKIIKTWEGTLNEGYGEKLTTYFSISNDEIAQDLYAHEGREVTIYYEEYFVGWPRDTKYDVKSWEPHVETGSQIQLQNSGNTEKLLSKTLFCSLLGTLISDQDLYQKVKQHVEKNNLYLYKQISECNE